MITINTVVTSKEAILNACRTIVSEQGLAALNMRAVAQRCGIALGSLYNYFSSKEELMTAAIENVWQDIFHMEHTCQRQLPFPDYVRWIFESVGKGTVLYPNFFTAHSLMLASNSKSKAREMMDRYFSHIKKGMLESLCSDPAIRKDAFSDNFRPEAFIDFILKSLVALLLQQQPDCNILIEIIRRTVYFH